MRMFFKMVVAGVFATLCASATFAQGCALCYNDAAATGPSALAALRHGILVLIIPPTAIFVTMLTTLYRRRNLYRESVEGVAEMPTRDLDSISEVILHLS